MKIVLAKVFIDKSKNRKFDYVFNTDWIPAAGTLISTGEHTVEILTVAAWVDGEGELLPMLRCRVGRDPKKVESAVEDGWVEVSDFSAKFKL